MFKKFLIGLIVVIGGFFAFIASRPDHYHVERSTSVSAPGELVIAQIDQFRAWAAWSPWEKRDPNAKKTYEGPERGVGAMYSWQGNPQVGKGKMTITEEQAPTKLRIQTQFIEPFPSIARSSFDLAPSGSDTKVTWSLDGDNSFMGKFFGLFFDMDKVIGPDYAKGLEQLKAIAEAKAAEQKTAAAAAQAAVVQAAAAAAAEPAPAAAAAK
jgi:hypothetical protein